MELDFDNVRVTIRGKQLVSALSLSVGTGEVVGLVGPNGSGKSTALRCAYRALKPSTGTVRISGQDIQELGMRQSARRIAALTQEGGSDFDFTVTEVVAFGRTPHQRGNEPLTAREQELCHRAMEQVDILHLADRGILELSGGEKQRVLIARALVQEPEVLILDEPTNHLDVRHQIQLLSMVRRSELTIMVVLHDLNLAAATCDRLGVLCNGRLVALGTPQEVLTSELLLEVFGIKATVVTHPFTNTPQVLFSLDSAQTHPLEPAVDERPFS